MDAQTLEHRLGRLLGVGSAVSTTFFAAGLLAQFAAVDARWAEWLVTAGLVILFATPFARVLVTTVNYWHERDWRFAIMTTIVLLVLIASVVVAIFARPV